MASTAEQIAFETGWNLHTPPFESSKRQFEHWGPSTSLGAMSMQAMQELDSIMFVKDHEAGDILFMEREPLKRAFVVISGDVRLSMQDLCGRRLTFHVARRGSVLGIRTQQLVQMIFHHQSSDGGWSIRNFALPEWGNGNHADKL